MIVKKTYYGYILNTHFKLINDEIKKTIIQTKGDIFEIFITLYDFLDNNCLKNDNIEFYRHIFENLKTSEDSVIFQRIIKEEPKKVKDYYEYIDTTKLKVNSIEDLETIEKILFTVTTKAIVMRFKYNSNTEARTEYLKQIQYLKYGMLLNNGL